METHGPITKLTDLITITVRLGLSTVDAEIDRSGKGTLPEKAGIGVHDLNHFGVIFRQPEPSRSVVFDQWFSWI